VIRKHPLTLAVALLVALLLAAAGVAGVVAAARSETRNRRDNAQGATRLLLALWLRFDLAVKRLGFVEPHVAASSGSAYRLSHLLSLRRSRIRRTDAAQALPTTWPCGLRSSCSR